MSFHSAAQGERIDVLGVGHATFTSINRRFYRALAAAGFTVELVIPRRVLPSSREADPAEPADPRIHWTEVKGSNNRFWQFTALKQILDERRPRIVYLENDPACTMAITISRWAAVNGAFLVCYSNITDLPPLWEPLSQGEYKRTIRTLLYQWLARMANDRLAAVFAICHDGLKAMEVMGLGSRTRMMPLGYDPELFRPDPIGRSKVRAQLGLTATTIAYFGRVVPIKGVHVLLDALELLGDFEWQFLIDEFLDSDSTTYAQQIDQRLHANPLLAARTIKFTASHAMMPDFMNAADITVLASVWKEQYGRVIPEAMACGKSVVVADAGALPELVGGAGLVVPQNDAPALARAIRDLLIKSEMREQLGRQAAVRAVRDLSIPAQVRCVAPTLERLLGKRETSVPTAGPEYTAI